MLVSLNAFAIPKIPATSLLEKISIGELKVITPTQTWDFGLYSPAHPNLRAVLQVRSDAFWTRIALFTDLGLAEAFMYGDGMAGYQTTKALMLTTFQWTARTCQPF